MICECAPVCAAYMAVVARLPLRTPALTKLTMFVRTHSFVLYRIAAMTSQPAIISYMTHRTYAPIRYTHKQHHSCNSTTLAANPQDAPSQFCIEQLQALTIDVKT